MGETAAKLRQIFEATGRTRGVYFFDEFDAIGSQRGLASGGVGSARQRDASSRNHGNGRGRTRSAADSLTASLRLDEMQEPEPTGTG